MTREQLLSDPYSGVRPLSHAEEAERARNAELAAQWLPATSPFGHKSQVQVSQAEVSMTCAVRGGTSTSPRARPKPNPRRSDP